MAFAFIGLVCLVFLGNEFHRAHWRLNPPGTLTDKQKEHDRVATRAKRRANVVFAVCVASFLVPLHTSLTLTGTELFIRFALFSPLFFIELVMAILGYPNVVDWRFQMCATAWLLTTSTSATVLCAAALVAEARWICKYKNQRDSKRGGGAPAFMPNPMFRPSVRLEPTSSPHHIQPQPLPRPAVPMVQVVPSVVPTRTVASVPVRLPTMRPPPRIDVHVDLEAPPPPPPALTAPPPRIAGPVLADVAGV